LLQPHEQRVGENVEAAQCLTHATDDVETHKMRQIIQHGRNVNELIIIPANCVTASRTHEQRWAHWNSRLCAMRFVTRDETEATIISLRMRATLSR
jgi:hypothetical protein